LNKIKKKGKKVKKNQVNQEKVGNQGDPIQCFFQMQTKKTQKKTFNLSNKVINTQKVIFSVKATIKTKKITPFK